MNKRIIAILALTAITLLAGVIVRSPGPGGGVPSVAPPPVADITVSGFTRAAIVTAFNQCTGNAGGRTIFFPQGTYVVNATIPLPAPACTLFGVRAKSIIDTTSCGTCYAFQSSNGALRNGTIYNLNFLRGAINFDYMDDMNIHHNVFNSIQTASVIGANGGMSNTTIDSNVAYGNPCPSPCGSTSPIFVKVDYVVHDINITNNWIENMWEGMSVGGPDSPSLPSYNITVTGNTILGSIRMGIEFLRPRDNSTFSNNYIAQARTQNETNFPTNVNSGAYQGQNPVPGCVNYPNGTGNGTQGGGNRWDCDSFAMSIVGYGANIHINNNKLYGNTNGVIGPVWGIETVNRSSSEVRNNVILGYVWNIWDDDVPDSRGNVSGNITCGSQNPMATAGQGGGNVYSNNCASPGIPAVAPVPNKPFDPVTGT